MPDPSYVVETAGKKIGLAFHLETAFYPPIPMSIRVEFMTVFTEYWDGDLPLEDLDQALKDRTGYHGGIGSYNFHQFLNSEDLN